MQTLDAPIFEVNRDSEWYKSAKKRNEDIDTFFAAFKEKYGDNDGFGFYHSEYFGVHAGTKCYELFKDQVLKNPTADGFYPFRKRSKYYKEIKELLDQIEDRSAFKSHDVFGMNNTTASQWIDERWFFSVKDEESVKDENNEVAPVSYKEYLKVVMARIE